MAIKGRKIPGSISKVVIPSILLMICDIQNDKTKISKILKEIIRVCSFLLRKLKTLTKLIKPAKMVLAKSGILVVWLVSPSVFKPEPYNM